MNKIGVWAAGALLSLMGVQSALAWTDVIKPDQDVNMICEMTAGSQCTGAVRIEAQLEGKDLSYASMPTMRLDRANLRRANLFGTILQLSNLKEADLTLANLERAHLHAVNLQRANLSFTNLQKANFLDADLRGADLTGSNVTGAIFTAALLGGATWPDGRVCADHSVGTCD
ncbi:MAG: pentapeptide repeat-containing protein [Cohaesibacter sp.]|nr:pentapeptide repeat-containing protein [Cohaesibacter sp.]